jgi:hypothetical protein
VRSVFVAPSRSAAATGPMSNMREEVDVSDLIIRAQIDSQQPDSHSLNVIFVHGLGGDLTETWHPKDRPGDYWPAWLADDHSSVGVWSMGYPAQVTQWSGKGTGMALSDRARQVLDYLVSLGFDSRPIVFIAHSLGGLLVKKILQLSSSLQVARLEPISRMTRGVVFLATPHSGSDLSQFAQGLKIFRPGAVMKDLEANSTELQELSDWYRNNALKLDIGTFVYREAKKYLGVWVVEPMSADPGMQGVIVIPQEADHFDIAKPESRLHPVYAGVTNIIATLVQVERDKQKLTLQLPDGVTLTVAPPQREPAPSVSVVSDLMFNDLSRGFRFQLPTSAGWSAPKELTFWDMLMMIGLSAEHVEMAKLGIQVLPMGRMMAESSVVYVGYGEPVYATLTDTSTTKALETFISRFRAVIGEEFDEEDAAEIRKAAIKQQLPMSTLRVQNSISVMTMNKALARESPIQPTLANLYITLVQQGGGAVDKLVANDHSIMWGSTQTLRNVEIDGDLRELTANTMSLLTEGEDAFYQVSIYYSPQTENPLLVWNELQEVAQSFCVLRSRESSPRLSNGDTSTRLGLTGRIVEGAMTTRRDNST